MSTTKRKSNIKNSSEKKVSKAKNTKKKNIITKNTKAKNITKKSSNINSQKKKVKNSPKIEKKKVRENEEEKKDITLEENKINEIKVIESMPKKNKTKKILLVTFLGIVFLLVLGVIFLFVKFRGVTLELGDKLNTSSFIRFGSMKHIHFDLSKVKENVVSSQKVPVKYFILRFNLPLDVVDTTPPKLEVNDLYRPLNYEFNLDDFVSDVSDMSEYDVSSEGSFDTKAYGTYNFKIVAKDKYDNITKKDVELVIGWIKKYYEIEMGNQINPTDLVFDPVDVNTISNEELAKVNIMETGTYKIVSVRDGHETEVEIKVTDDVTPPELDLRDITIYKGRKVGSYHDFITRAYDKVTEVDTKLLTNINYDKVGNQQIDIEASDKFGNKVTKSCNLKIILDTAGPRINGLNKITVNKGTNIDYRSGVSSYDDNYGSCNFEVDASGVDVSKHGTYYATYTSSDPLGNKSTSRRMVFVNHDSADTNELVRNIASNLSSDVEALRDYTRTNIKYSSSWGDNDPIWYGLNNWVGNCYVHASVFDALLKNKGYNTKMIWTTDRTHYWNMVYVNGKWVHMDSTPGRLMTKYSIMDDEKRYETLQGRDWDRNSWPKAE